MAGLIDMSSLEGIIATVLATYPQTQAIYLFDSYGSENEWPDSDVDIALLLPPEEAKRAGPLTMGDLRFALESLLQKDVDLVNLRQASTVFQKEIVFSERRVSALTNTPQMSLKCWYCRSIRNSTKSGRRCWPRDCAAGGSTAYERDNPEQED